MLRLQSAASRVTDPFSLNRVSLIAFIFVDTHTPCAGCMLAGALYRLSFSEWRRLFRRPANVSPLRCELMGISWSGLLHLLNYVVMFLLRCEILFGCLGFCILLNSDISFT